MARIKLHVPAELVDALYRDLQMVWEGETIMESETGPLAPDSDPELVRRARAHRHAASELLDQIDWDGRRDDRPVDLVGDTAFLDYVVRPLLHLFGDRINEACQAAVDQGASVEPILPLQQQLSMALDLLSRMAHASHDRGTERL